VGRDSAAVARDGSRGDDAGIESEDQLRSERGPGQCGGGAVGDPPDAGLANVAGAGRGRRSRCVGAHGVAMVGAGRGRGPHGPQGPGPVRGRAGGPGGAGLSPGQRGGGVPGSGRGGSRRPRTGCVAAGICPGAVPGPVRWEISWGLHRAGITELWVLRAEHVGYPGWTWLRELAEDEQLRLVLLTRGRPPNARQVAALRGCCWHHLNPDRLRLGGGRRDPPRPWWQHR